MLYCTNGKTEAQHKETKEKQRLSKRNLYWEWQTVVKSKVIPLQARCGPEGG